MDIGRDSSQGKPALNKGLNRWKTSSAKGSRRVCSVGRSNAYLHFSDVQFLHLSDLECGQLCVQMLGVLSWGKVYHF